MELGLTDKAFVVTAASSGLGLASARALVAEGAKVCLVARRQEVLDQLQAEFASAACVLTGDLSDAELPQRAVDFTVATFGRIDGALVSVGGPPKGGVLDNSDEQWTSAFGSVFLPALRVARAVVAHNAAARLAFVLSTSVRSPLPSMAISNGLRPGLGMLVKQLADELGPTGGRAVGLMPGSIATERLQYLYAQTPDPAAARAAAEAGVPLRRLGEPDEFGRVAAFVLSDAASYLTGCMIPIDGGALRTV